MKIVITEVFYDYFCGEKHYTHTFEGVGAITEAQKFLDAHEPFNYGDTFVEFHVSRGASDYSRPVERQPKHGLVLGYKPERVVEDAEVEVVDLFADLTVDFEF